MCFSNQGPNSITSFSLAKSEKYLFNVAFALVSLTAITLVGYLLLFGMKK